MKTATAEATTTGGARKPELLPDIPEATYRRWPEVSQTELKLLLGAPAKLRHERDNPSEPTDAMALGTALHVAVFEPDRFNSEYVRMPQFNRRTNAGKAEHAAFIAEHPSHLSDDDYTAVIEMRDSARDAAGRLLRGGRSELSARWCDPDTGIWCKLRVDWAPTDIPILVDLKSTIDATLHGFPRQVYNFGYHIQGAFYSDGMAQCGVATQAFVIIAVEKQPPYLAAVYELDDTAIAVGRDKYKEALATYRECMITDEWPGYERGVQVIGLPGWAT